MYGGLLFSIFSYLIPIITYKILALNYLHIGLFTTLVKASHSLHKGLTPKCTDKGFIENDIFSV